MRRIYGVGRAVLAALACWAAVHPVPARAQQIPAMYDRAAAHFSAGRYVQAEALTRSTLDLATARLGANHRAVGRGWFLIGRIHARTGRIESGQMAAQRAIDVWSQSLGPESAQVAAARTLLGAGHARLGKVNEAERQFLQAEAILAKTKPVTPWQPSELKRWMAINLFFAGRLAEAEQKLREAIKGLPPRTPRIVRAHAQFWLGRTLVRRGFTAEAEQQFVDAIAGYDSTVGEENSDLAMAQERLASLYLTQGRRQEAEAMLRRSVAIHSRMFGPNNDHTAWSRSLLANVLMATKRYEEAETTLREAMSGATRVGMTESKAFYLVLSQLGIVLTARGNHAEAGQVLQRALQLSEKLVAAGGATGDEAKVALALNQAKTGDLMAAEENLLQVVTHRETLLGPSHPAVARALFHLSNVYAGAGKLNEARTAIRKTVELVESRTDDRSELLRAMATEGSEPWRQRSYGQVIRLAWLASAAGADRQQAVGESLLASQRAIATSAAAAVTQMSTRLAQGDGALADLLRQIQNLSRERSDLERQFASALGQGPEAGTERVRDRIALRRDLDRIAGTLTSLQARLESEFPTFASLIRRGPLGLEEIRALLADNEALVATHVADNATFVWVVTRTDAHWHRADVSSTELGRKLDVLRCGLETGAWTDPARREQCKSLGLELTSTSLPFDLSTSWQLYQHLLAPAASLIAGKALIIVPSGPLSSLQFQALTTAPPQDGPPDYAQARWLTLDHAVAILPSIPSLRALRAPEFKSAPLPFIGYGAPVFSATPPRAPEARNLARTVAAKGPVSRALPPQQSRPFNAYFKGTRPDPEALRRGLSNLPETRGELIEVATALGSGEDAVRTGPLATETAVKSTPLDTFRVVYFATHGLVAGEVEGLGEPALALTIPTAATPVDDGLLTASEVSQLKLNADWVVLSACNTAAGAAPGTEALSGLASAFFYAGARSLLVTHWQVWSDAAVAITTGTFRALAKSPGQGRSQALRQSMRDLIASGDPEKSHPAYWAPFIVVGDGR